MLRQIFYAFLYKFCFDLQHKIACTRCERIPAKTQAIAPIFQQKCRVRLHEHAKLALSPPGNASLKVVEVFDRHVMKPGVRRPVNVLCPEIPELLLMIFAALLGRPLQKLRVVDVVDVHDLVEPRILRVLEFLPLLRAPTQQSLIDEIVDIASTMWTIHSVLHAVPRLWKTLSRQ